MTKRRLRCSSCSNWLRPWGRTAAGRKRFRCPYCGSSQTLQRRKTADFYKLFHQYILWGHTYEQLASFSGYSIQYLTQKFHAFLLQESPPLHPINQSQLEVAFLLIDGLWFGRWFVLMVYRQSRNLTILRITVAGKEASTKIEKDLKILKRLYRFTGIVSDGGTGIRNAVVSVFGRIPHQICLAHMHRAVISCLGKFPKDTRVKKLKHLADHVWLIESREALGWWVNKLKTWIKTNKDFLNEIRHVEGVGWWYIHKGVRKAVRILVSLPHTSFKFLNNPLMPKTTNELEAQFGHLGKRWLAHRGLKKERWEKFLQWFVYFYNHEKQTSNKSRKV